MNRLIESNRTPQFFTVMLALALSIIIFLLMPVSSAFASSKALFSDAIDELPGGADAPSAKRANKIKALSTTAKSKKIKIDLGALSGNSIDIALSENRVRTFVKTKVETQSPDLFIWYGKAPDTDDSVTLVVHKGDITGTIRDSGNLYKIEPIGNSGHVFIELDSTRFQPDHPAGTTQQLDKPEHKTSADTFMTRSFYASDLAAPDATVISGKTHIDVLVLYPPTVSNVVADVRALATLAVAETNQAYANSQVNIQMNLVGTQPIAYSELNKSYNQILSDVSVLQDVKNKRDAARADIVVVLSANTSYCGMAYVLPSESMAVGIVAYNCATGYYTFGHEIGHIQGLQHDPIASPGSTPFAYGHGYQSPNSSPKWRTLMAYNCATGCPRIQYFSNPNVNYNGLAMGTPSVSNNARVLNETAGRVSAFRSGSTVSPTAPIPASTAPTSPPATPTVTWTKCATENSICSFSGTRQVRYGANGFYAYRTATSSIACNNATFTDVLRGVIKSCDYSSVTHQTPTTTWTACATENNTCFFSGTRQVRYGANGIFAYRTATGSIACNNATFTDVLRGAVKSCSYAN